MSRAELEADLRDGLWRDPPRLPPRWFYDERGSRLFDDITRLPEYYPTRAEAEILAARSPEIVRVSGATSVHELGAGMSTKTRVLLDALTSAAGTGADDGAGPDGEGLLFAPLDISREVLLESAEELRREYPMLTVEPAVSDFHDLPPLAGEPGRRLLLFLGGTIGNFEEAERAAFLDRVRSALSPGDHLLLGADLVKDPARLVAAYDDAAGVTADFDLNLIDVVRRTTAAEGLRREDFAHQAVWDEDASRVEMRLVARRDVAATFPGLGRTWRLAQGDHLRTEISRKFRLDELRDALAQHAFDPVESWTDEAEDFSLTLARAAVDATA